MYTFCRADFAPDSPFLRELSVFADPASPADLQRVAGACRLLLSFTDAPPRAAAGGPQPPQQKQLVFCSFAGPGAGLEQAVTVLRAQRLVSLSVAALAAHAEALATHLQQPRQGGSAAAAAAAAGPVSILIEAAVVLTGADAWKAAVGAARAADITAQLLAYAARRGLFRQLAHITAVALPEHAPPPGRPGAVPASEALLTSLVVRLLSVQQAVAGRLGPQLDPSRLLAGLLCQPLLLQRCPTLRPLALRLWRQAVASLHSLTAPQLAQWLGEQAGAAGLAAAAGAALLGNLLEHAAAALKAEDVQAAAAARPAAVQFVVLAGALLQLLPLQPYFPAGWEEDAEEDGEQRRSSRRSEGDVWRLELDPEEIPLAGVLSQLQVVSDAALLRSVVRLLLPAASLKESSAAATAAATGRDGGSSSSNSGQVWSAEALRSAAAMVQQLCRFLHRLLQLPGQRQRVLISLAVGGELVQRMWFTYLRPAHDAGGPAWLPSSDASCDPGWMLPLSLFSLAYSSAIMLGENLRQSLLHSLWRCIQMAAAACVACSLPAHGSAVSAIFWWPPALTSSALSFAWLLLPPPSRCCLAPILPACYPALQLTMRSCTSSSAPSPWRSCTPPPTHEACSASSNLHCGMCSGE